ncbi:MAG: LamG-like jellyroll fold domain-containing protein, partial [Verrucomicrobiota bacterium]
ADGTILVNWNTVTPGFDRGAPVNAIQLVLNAPATPAPPVLTAQPQPTVAPAGGSAQLSVTATGNGLTYQWRKNGRNLPDGGNVSGARTARLTLNAFSEADEAVYSVAVFNAGGSVVSGNASARLSKYNINDQLVGYWKFDETSGNTAANSAAGGRAASVNGTASWSAGRIGNAFGFDGGTYLLVDSFATAKRQIAGSAWVNIPAGVSSTMPIFRNAQGALGLGAGVGPGTPAGQFEFGLTADANTGEVRLQAVIGVGPNLLRASTPASFLGDWHHVAFSADGAQLRLYLDGTEVAVTDYLGALNSPDIPQLSFGAWLNRDENGTLGPDVNTPNFLGGQVDDVGLWTRGLSAEEVRLIRAAGLASKGLTTVTLTPPVVEPGTLSAALSGANVSISWDRGVLQTAPSPTGPWTDATGNGSVTEAASANAQFYR